MQKQWDRDRVVSELFTLQLAGGDRKYVVSKTYILTDLLMLKNIHNVDPLSVSLKQCMMPHPCIIFTTLV
jgi:hypothetical protein